MSTDVDLENDPFLILLTDALRAGPGSPQWHEAVARLKTSADPVDEYRLLIEAREALESGRDYRSVRAGPNFTRKLMSSLDETRQHGGRTPRRISTPAIIAFLAGVVILTVVGLLVAQLWPRQPVSAVNTQKAIDDLAASYFPTDTLSANFADGIPMGWRKIGSLPLNSTDAGLIAAPAEHGSPNSGQPAQSGGYVGGGIVAPDPIPADQPFTFQVNLRVASPGEHLTPQVFVSNSPDFSPDRATGPQELVWWLQDRTQKIVVGGNVERNAPLDKRSGAVAVRIVMNHDLAIVETDGQRLWAGPNRLGNNPRYVGIRFIRTPGPRPADVIFQSARVSKP